MDWVVISGQLCKFFKFLQLEGFTEKTPLSECNIWLVHVLLGFLELIKNLSEVSAFLYDTEGV